MAPKRVTFNLGSSWEEKISWAGAVGDKVIVNRKSWFGGVLLIRDEVMKNLKNFQGS